MDLDKNPGVNKISAPDAAFKIYKSIGRTNYINMLSIIKEIWDGDEKSLQRWMLNGFGYIFKHCSDKINKKEMINTLSGYPVKKLEERTKELTGSLEKRAATAIAEQYNKRRRSSNKIILP